MTLQKSLSDNRGQSVLIVSVSARGLTQAARRSGFKPYAVDFFADMDLREAACGWQKYPGDIDDGFHEEPLLNALGALANEAGAGLAGVVCGAGFEDRPHLLSKIAERWPLLGNSAGTVAAVNDPGIFFGEIEELGLSYPKFQFVKPSDPRGWLYKKCGGAGGGHIKFAQDVICDGEGYFQDFIKGRSISALICGYGNGGAVFYGLSEQWSVAGDNGEMRYGGAVRPARVDHDLGDRLAAAACDIAEAFSLVGLNSVDFLVSDGAFFVLEVNPRPGATLDIYDDDGAALFERHVDAICGVEQKEAPSYRLAKASAVQYAPYDLVIPDSISWPTYAADLPHPGEKINQGTPLCTVVAVDEDAYVTKNTLHRYSVDILHVIGDYNK